MDNFDIIKEAKNVFKIEMESLEKVKDSLGKDFENISKNTSSDKKMFRKNQKNFKYLASLR